jgi:tRNA (guanine37-N1)-methyltransferase
VRIDILTLFPGMFDGWLNSSIINKAIERGLVDIRLHDFRAYAHDSHHTVDDYPYGGGAGMVLKPEPIFETVEAIKGGTGLKSCSTILLTPQGRLLNQEISRQLAGYQHLIVICGRYEGVDERVARKISNDEISIGDYVINGGEVAAMVVAECVARILPGVVGSEESITEDTHMDGLLKYPQFTRPSDYRGLTVPPVLVSGNHAQIALWRRQQSLLRTANRRPDLLHKAILSNEDRKYLSEIGYNKVNL